MKRVRTRTDSGVVCEMKVFNISDRADVSKARPPRPRFRDEAERAAHRLGVARRRFIRIVNENFSPSSRYSTLTLDDEHEVLTFKEARRIRDNFAKRIKYRYPNARLVIVMGRGKSTHRIHLHMISEGIPEADIIKLWGQGEIKRVEPMRAHNYYNGIDHGPDYTGLAIYLFSHWTPEQGGRYWKGTRNLRRPKPGKPVVVKREYSEKRPPQAPKGYILVECQKTKYGYFYFKFVREPVKESRRKRQS